MGGTFRLTGYKKTICQIDRGKNCKQTHSYDLLKANISTENSSENLQFWRLQSLDHFALNVIVTIYRTRN